MDKHVHEWVHEWVDHEIYYYCSDSECRRNEYPLTAEEVLSRLNTTERLSVLYKETKPYAMRMQPDVVYNKSTPSLSFLAETVERFMTIMRDADILEGK